MRARLLLLLAPAVVLAVLGALVARGHPVVYRASATVLLRAQPGSGVSTGVALARLPAVTSLAVAGAPVRGVDGTWLLSHSTARRIAHTGLLELSVVDPLAARARLLASRYATAYVAYRRTLDRQALGRALAALERRIAALARLAPGGSPLLTTLSARAEALRTAQQLQTANAVLVSPAGPARVGGRPYLRDASAGAAAGALAGVVALLALLTFRLRGGGHGGRRERDPAAVLPGARFLGRIPPPAARVRLANHLSMLSDEDGLQAAAIRDLAQRVDDARALREIRVLLIGATEPGSDSSTTAANLAVALAQQGVHTALVELDIAHPTIATLFGMGSVGGLAAVAGRQLSLGRAVVPVDIGVDEPAVDPLDDTAELELALAPRKGKQRKDRDRATRDPATRDPATDELIRSLRRRVDELTTTVRRETTPALGVLPAGDDAAMLDPRTTARAIELALPALAHRFELVLVDAPSLDDPITQSLLRSVDGVLAVLPETSFPGRGGRRLVRRLGGSRGPLLGYVVTGGAHVRLNRAGAAAPVRATRGRLVRA